MEMKTVHYYIAVAEELNLTRAAERLMMSQPPLSYQMKKLEEELGVTLFLRGKRRLELTDAGKLFLRRAYELEALEEKSREEMQSFGKGISGNLSIGLVEGRASAASQPAFRPSAAATPAASPRAIQQGMTR